MVVAFDTTSMPHTEKCIIIIIILEHARRLPRLTCLYELGACIIGGGG